MRIGMTTRKIGRTTLRNKKRTNGDGFPSDVPTWGRILFDGANFLDIAPHWVLFPGSCIFIIVLSINFIGDGLRDALDPRRKV